MTQNAIKNAVRQTKIDRAKRMSLDDRLSAGARLYAEQCELVQDLVAGLHPEWTPEQIREEMNRRQKISHDRNSRRFYRPVEAAISLPKDVS